MKMKSNKTKETLDVFLSRVEELNSGIANITENAEKLKTIQKKGVPMAGRMIEGS